MSRFALVPVVALSASLVACAHSAPTVGRTPTNGPPHQTHDSGTRRIYTSQVVVGDSMVGDSAVHLPDSVARKRAMAVALRAAQRSLDSTVGDAVRGAQDTSIFGRAMLAAQGASLATESITVTPATLRVRVGGVVPVRGSVTIQAFDSAGHLIDRFAPLLEMEDPQIAQLSGGSIVGLKQGVTVLLVRPIPVPRLDRRPMPVARLKIEVNP